MKQEDSIGQVRSSTGINWSDLNANVYCLEMVCVFVFRLDMKTNVC